MTTIDPFALREAFGSYLTGVTVVTTRDHAGQPLGFTANSFTSVSLEPPMLLVCPSRSLSSFAAFEQSRSFAVNILAEGQEAVSNTFAGFKGDRFARVDWRTDTSGCPVIAGTAAHFSCRTTRVIPAGDHVVLMGEVNDFSCSGLRGLGYAAGQYFSLGLERDVEETAAEGARAFAGVIVEHDNQVLLSSESEKLCPPQIPLESPARIRGTVKRWLLDKGFDISLGNAYSIFEDADSGDHFTYFLAQAGNPSCFGLGDYYPVKELPNLPMVSPAHASMLKRYSLEHQTRSFGLYLGDDRDGDLLNYSMRS